MFLNEKIAEFYCALVIQEQNCITRNRPGENLMYAGHLAADKQAEFPGQSVHWMDSKNWRLQKDSVA